MFSIFGFYKFKKLNNLKKNKARFNKKTLTKFAWQSGNPCKGYLLMPEDVQDLMVNPDYDEV